MLRRSIRAFDSCPLVSELILVAGKNRAQLEQEARLCSKPAAGGGRRSHPGQKSAKNGVLAANGELVAIHDAARPFVSQTVIQAVLLAAAQQGAGSVVPVKDTVKQALAGDGRIVPPDCMVQATPDRSTLYAVQTPQCFERAAYLEALASLDPEGARLVTDDCSLFELTGRPVQLTQGDYANIKITTREDLPRPEAKGECKMRIGHGYDVHRLVGASSSWAAWRSPLKKVWTATRMQMC